MQEAYITDKVFEKITVSLIVKAEYANCTFNNCNFSEADLSAYKFSDCVFKDCNLSLAKLNKTTLQDVQFRDCKMLGLRFDTCHDFGIGFSFENCQLDHSSFFKLKIKKTNFKDSSLREADLSECDLSGSVFDNCDLSNAIFDRTIPEKADFRTSYNYSIDPENNRIKKAKFSVNGLSGLLDKYGIEIEK